MAIRVTVNTRGLDKKLMTEEVVKQALRRTGMKYMLQVRRRVKRGESVDGGAFKPYSQSYEENKAAAGRLGSNYWLRMTGQMLSSMVVNVIGKLMTVTFEGTRMSQSFRDPAKQRAFQKTSRSQRGGFESIWRAGRRKRAERREARGASKKGRLTYSDNENGKEVSNALLAWVNDKLRPFVGVNEKELAELGRYLRRELLKGIRSTKPA